MHLHTARWVVPITEPPIEFGAVAVKGGVILDVGPARELRKSHSCRETDHGDSILCPALVNAHVHLELSALRGRLARGTAFVKWIESLISAREGLKTEDVRVAFREALCEMKREGIIAVGDVGNEDQVSRFADESSGECPIQGIFFREIITPLEAQANESFAVASGTEENDDVNKPKRPTGLRGALAAHSPYSVSPLNLKAVKEYDRRRNLPFMIHVAESREEVEFLARGSGPIRGLMKKRGYWPLDYHPPGTSPVAYLDSLGILDSDTVCVHCVHLSDDDVAILAQTGATVCLCPGSNMYLDVGIPPVDTLLRANVPLALGTDSLASNDRLSVFREMHMLSRIAPSVPAHDIFRAATWGGARALGLLEDLGSLSRGKKAVLLVVGEGSLKKREVMDYLVSEVASSNTIPSRFIEGP